MLVIVLLRGAAGDSGSRTDGGTVYAAFTEPVRAGCLHRRLRLIGPQIMFVVGGEHDLTDAKSITSPAERTAGQAGWATAPGTCSRSTCTGSCSAQPPSFRSTSTRLTRTTDGFDRLCEDCRYLMETEGPRHLGGPRRSPALCVLQGHVLGGARPSLCASRSAAGLKPGPRLEAEAGRDLGDRDTRRAE